MLSIDRYDGLDGSYFTGNSGVLHEGQNGSLIVNRKKTSIGFTGNGGVSSLPVRVVILEILETMVETIIVVG